MKSNRQGVLVSAAPFIHVRESTASLMLLIITCLLPSLAWSVFLFGSDVLVIVGVSVASAMAAEAGLSLVRRPGTLMDGTALLTGLLIGFSMPPSVPLYIPILSSVFAIAVVKWSFGGLGANWMNPAMAGVVFSHVNWPGALNSWKAPRFLTGVDGVSSVTPLGLLRSASENVEGPPMDLLREAGYRISSLDKALTARLNEGILSGLGARLPEGYVDLALGIRPGSLGEMAGLFLLAGSIILVARRVVRWEIPAACALVFGILVRLFGTGSEPLFSGDVLFAFFTGSFLLVTFFCATDPSTSPMSRPGLLLYGSGVGALIFLFRRYGAGSEGSAYAVIIMNCLVSLLDSALPAARSRRRSVASQGVGN
ncbi:MAG TPA: RnfABCDGE type electron transport complex subunit D [Spirochaetia bacterium]|nr:RnfABCDGE type electron transport complex subunit D [Spirochaetales bacterium]HRY80982.1 RnfABCDGE type electron transport complex subunit D [Spirochaetia bacterium]